MNRLSASTCAVGTADRCDAQAGATTIEYETERGRSCEDDDDYGSGKNQNVIPAQSAERNDASHRRDTSYGNDPRTFCQKCGME